MGLDTAVGDRVVRTEPAGLAVSHLSMSYPDGTHVLDDVSFGIRSGEMVSIVGPSGCGKSTILRIASGLLPGATGDVRAAGALGYVFQDPTLMPWRTVLGNVGYLAQLHGIPREERTRLARDAIRRVHLEGFEKHYPRQLSGGMKMRVSIARSLTLGPDLFLFDEPFGALDEITRESLNDELLDMFVRDRFAGVFVTHSIPEAVFLGTRVLVMSARPGRIVADIPVPFPYPRDVSIRYSSDFAAVAGQVSSALRGNA